MRPLLLAFSILFVLVAAPVFVNAIDINACQNIAASGVYQLTQNLAVVNADCLTISASDVDLNCGGFSISGNLAANTYGVRTIGNRNNVTVRNCVVASFAFGVGIPLTTNSNVSYNTIVNLSSNDAAGVNFGGTNFSFVGFNTFRNISTTGAIGGAIVGGGVNNSRIVGNLIENFSMGGTRGVLIDDSASQGINSQNNTVSGNTIRNLYDQGVETHGWNATVISNTVTNVSGNGIYHNGNNSLITLNSVANSTRVFTTGITVESGHLNVNVTSNTISGTGQGIDFRAVNNSLIAHNVVSNITSIYQGGLGVGAGGATTGNTVFNNTVRDTMAALPMGAAISTAGASYNVSYNAVNNWNGSGISINGDNGRLSSNTVTGINGINAWALQYQGQFGAVSSNTVANMTGQSVNGFYSSSINHSTFTQNTFRNFTGPFSVATSIGQDPALSQNVTVFSNTVTDVNGTGLGAYGRAFNVSYNTITGASGSANGQSLVYLGEYGVIQSNTIANVTASGNLGIRAYRINHTRIFSNTVENFNLGSTAIQVEEGTMSRNNTVSSNVIRNFNGSGIGIYSNNATVSLNTLTNLTGSGANGIYFEGVNGSISQNTLANSTTAVFIGIITSGSVADNVNITYNTLTNLTARGIDFRNNNSLIAHNTFSQFSGIGDSYNSVIEAVTNGIHDVTIYNNTLSDSFRPLLNPAFLVNGLSMNVSYNTIQQYNGTAMSLGNSNNSFVLWNTVLNFSQGSGFDIGQFSSNNVISYNAIANASGAQNLPNIGAILNGLANNFSYNNLTNINTTTFNCIAGCISSRIHDNLFSNGRGTGVQFNTGANNNWIVGNRILNFTNFAVAISGSRNNSFYSNTLNQSFPSAGPVFYTDNSTSVLVDNQVVSNGSDNNNDWVATSASSAVLINTTLNISRFDWQDVNSNLTLQYYLTVNVTNGVSWQPVSNAAVDIRNRNSTSLLAGLLTNATGQTTQNLTVLFINSTGVTNHTPHNVSVSRLGWSNSSNFTISGKANVVMLLSSGCGTIFASSTILNNISVNGSTCVTFGADNLALDLNGFTISGNRTVNTYGVLAAGRTNVNVSSGRLQGFDNGVLFSASNNSNMFNVTLFNHSVGFAAFGVNNTNLSYSSVLNSSQHGVSATSSFNLTIQNNTIQDNGLSGATFAGVHYLNSNTSAITSNTILRNPRGLFFNGTANNRVYYGSIINSSSRGLLFSDGSVSNLVSSGSVSGVYTDANYRDVGTQNASSNTLHDFSFNKSSVVFDSPASSFTVNYTLYVNVTNSTSALSGAQVNFTVSGGAAALTSQLSNVSGFATQNITEYVQSGSQVYGVSESSRNPYTLLVSLAGYDSNSTLNTLSARTQLNIRLSLSSPSGPVVVLSGSASPTPTVNPAPSPVPTPAEPSTTPTPSVTVEPVVETPSVLPTPSPTPVVVVEEEVGVLVEDRSDTSTAESEPVKLSVRKELFVEKVPLTESPTGVVSTVRVSFIPVETTSVGYELKVFKATFKWDMVPYLGSSLKAYTDAGYIFSHPDRIVEPILEGSAVVTWMFENVESGKETSVEVKVPNEVSEEQVRQLSAPKVIAKSVKPLVSVTPVPTITSLTPSAGRFDWTLPAIGLLAVLAASAFFFVKRKPDGL